MKKQSSNSGTGNSDELRFERVKSLNENPIKATSTEFNLDPVTIGNNMQPNQAIKKNDCKLKYFL